MPGGRRTISSQRLWLGGESLELSRIWAAHRPHVMLIHGGGNAWWNYLRQARALSSPYHVILPTLDGHGEGVPDSLSLPQSGPQTN